MGYHLRGRGIGEEGESEGDCRHGFLKGVEPTGEGPLYFLEESIATGTHPLFASFELFLGTLKEGIIWTPQTHSFMWAPRREWAREEEIETQGTSRHTLHPESPFKSTGMMSSKLG